MDLGRNLGTGEMDCFRWHSNLSNYLDGDLSTATKRQADAHLSTCSKCSLKLDHYRILLSAIAESNDRSHLLNHRTENSSQNVFNIFQSGQVNKTRWQRTPWFVRTLIEGVGIAVFVLVVFAMIPKIRVLYEQSLEKKLDTFDVTELLSEEVSRLTTDDEPTEDEIDPVIAQGEELASHEQPNEELPSAFEESERPLDDFDKGLLKVGNSEIWRFNIKTDSPSEMREKVVSALNAIEIEGANAEAFEGRPVPGGVQFDFIVPKESVPDIKRRMETLALEGSGPNIQSPFTWFKNRYRKKIPRGYTRVVIWLSQI